MPDEFARVGAKRENAGEIKIVAALRAANLLIPGRAVSRADIKQIEFGIVSERIPYSATSTHLPPFARPRLRGLLQRGRFERLRRIARHGVEAPRLLARLGVVSRDVPAHAVFGAPLADDNLTLHNARRARNRVRLILINSRDLPEDLSVSGVERDQPPVERADIDLALVNGDAAIDHVAASPRAVRTRDLRVVLPQLPASLPVERVDYAPTARRVHHAVNDNRRRLKPAIGLRVERPGQSEFLNIARVDLLQRAVASL